MDRLIKNSGKSTRIPSYMHQTVKSWNAATRELEYELDRTPTHQETSERLGLSPAKLKHILEAIRVFNSGPQPGGEEVQTSLADLVVDHRRPNCSEGEEEVERVLHCVDSIPDERAKDVLRMRFDWRSPADGTT